MHFNSLLEYLEFILKVRIIELAISLVINFVLGAMAPKWLLLVAPFSILGGFFHSWAFPFPYKTKHLKQYVANQTKLSAIGIIAPLYAPLIALPMAIFVSAGAYFSSCMYLGFIICASECVSDIIICLVKKRQLNNEMQLEDV